jgi:hypothetical protein
MPEELPRPTVHAFIPCRDLFQDVRTGEYILVGPFDHKLAAPHFPTSHQFAIYGMLSEVRGTVFLELCLMDSEGQLIWRDPQPDLMPSEDLLQTYRLRFHYVTIPVPAPGLYDLLLLAGGHEIARYPLEFVEPASQ